MVYKRNPSLQNQKSPHNHKEWVEQLFVLDKNTIKLPNGKGDGAVIINGTIWGPKTSQIIVGGGVQQKVWERYCLLQGVFGIVDPGRGSAT